MGAVAYESELFIRKFKSQFKCGFAKVVVTRAGRLQEWPQGELRLYRLTDHEAFRMWNGHLSSLFYFFIVINSRFP